MTSTIRRINLHQIYTHDPGIVAAPDVTVLEQSSLLSPSYTPPSTSPDSYVLTFKRIWKKLASAKHLKIRYDKTSVDSISSIDAEWSVYWTIFLQKR